MQQFLDGLITRWGIQAEWQIVLVYALGMLLFAVVLILWASVFAGFASFVERRIAARMQSRVGPNRVGPNGILQWVADGLKCLLKEDLIPKDADRFLFKIAPFLVFMGMFGTFAVLPFSEKLIIADLNVGLFYLVAVTGFISVGVIMAGWASNNKWSLLGGIRAANQIVSYEIPTGLALLAVVITSGTMSTQGIIQQQGWVPWEWNLFRTPFLFLGFFIYFIAALAEANRTPFDLPEGESELVAGYNTEYSGMRFALFFLAEWAELYVIAAVAVLAFMGGWRTPGFIPESIQPVAQVLFFIFKTFFWVFVTIWIRWTLPRVRVDQMMELCWKYLVPLGFVVVLGTAAWEVFVPMNHPAALALRIALFGVALVVAVRFVLRVRYNLRQTEAQVHLNPIV